MERKQHQDTHLLSYKNLASSDLLLGNKFIRVVNAFKNV